MHLVGHLLQTTAISKSIAAERDMFARSAYNRYYYACFLATREMISGMNSKWEELPHADYAPLLKGQVLDALRTERTKARKSDDHALERQLGAAMDAARALSNLLLKANGTRVAADYGNNPVAFTAAERFTLNSVDITEAHGWLDQVHAFISTIKAAWKQINA